MFSFLAVASKLVIDSLPVIFTVLNVYKRIDLAINEVEKSKNKFDDLKFPDIESLICKQVETMLGDNKVLYMTKKMVGSEKIDDLKQYLYGIIKSRYHANRMKNISKKDI